MTANNDLLPCPFCGHKVIFVSPDETGSGGQWVAPIHVGCNKCKAEQIGNDEAEAKSNWNRRQSAMPTDPLEAFKNPLTPYGLLVRALRITAGTSLMEMSQFCGQPPSYMSGVETGREPLTPELICFTHRFFHDKGLDVTLYLLQQSAGARRRIGGEFDA